MHNIIVFGPPGSGKGTQSQNIVDKYALSHFSSGDMLRSEIAKGSSCGKKVERLMAGGNLVPDDIVLKMALKYAVNRKAGNGVVFDGFPRTLLQAELLDKHLARKKLDIALVLAINITEEEIYERIMGRSSHSGRPDDTPEIIEHRIQVYLDITYPVIEYYKQQNKLAWVSGMAPVDTVFGRICSVIETCFPALAGNG